MKIAIIGWGSLIWDPRELPREGTWQDDGPELKIEFSRISKDARLTLVLDVANGTPVKTKYVMSPRTSLDDAIEDLREREGKVGKCIGWVDIVKNTSSANCTHKQVAEWCRDKGFDAAIWTDLPPNFEKETKKPFSVDNAIIYLKSLPKNVRKEALKYIRNAPECVKTSLREEVNKIDFLIK
ncbi:MAG: hypothetical protein HY883_01000 [Deltaproteobacteria bacterium]|nr:hypothetical protein [Deltaproteobacteria bacterium]